MFKRKVRGAFGIKRAPEKIKVRNQFPGFCERLAKEDYDPELAWFKDYDRMIESLERQLERCRNSHAPVYGVLIFHDLESDNWRYMVANTKAEFDYVYEVDSMIPDMEVTKY